MIFKKISLKKKIYIYLLYYVQDVVCMFICLVCLVSQRKVSTLVDNKDLF